MLAGRLVPALKIFLPLPGTIFRIFRRNEPREHGSSLISRNDRGNRRQNSLHPRRLPKTAGSKDVLHVDTKVNVVADFGDLRRAVPHRPPPSAARDNRRAVIPAQLEELTWRKGVPKSPLQKETFEHGHLYQ